MKAQIVLRDLEGRCVASVEPARMRVLQGGVLRWQVTNRCRRLEGKGQPALAVTRLKTNEDGRPASWLSEVCDAELALVELGTPLKGNVIHCDVPDEAPVGVYKYSLEGLIEPLDPVIEIIRPGGQG